jgi:hypothetical protein
MNRFERGGIITAWVSQETGISVEEIRAPGQRFEGQHIHATRQLTWFLVHHYANLNYKELSHSFNRHQSNIEAGVKRIIDIIHNPMNNAIEREITRIYSKFQTTNIHK